MKVKANLSLAFRDAQTAEAVYRSLEPDNVGFPRGVVFNAKRSGRELSFEVASESDPNSFLSTLDDLLESAKVSLDALERLEVR